MCRGLSVTATELNMQMPGRLSPECVPTLPLDPNGILVVELLIGVVRKDLDLSWLEAPTERTLVAGLPLKCQKYMSRVKKL
jgi:hypothetical protein